jgi:probable HAF family extracellular repeat protein
MNSSGTVVGQSDVSKKPDEVYGIPRYHGFVWSNGKLTNLGAIFKSHFNYLFGINDAGVAVGSADLKGDNAAHAFSWTNGTVQDLSPDGNISAGATGINNVGQIVGIWGQVDPDPTDGPPATTTLCPCFATLWQNGQILFLNNLVPSGWNLLLASAINDKGEILATGEFNGGPIETVLLKPKSPKEKQEANGRNLAPSPTTRLDSSSPRAIRRNASGKFEEIW